MGTWKEKGVALTEVREHQEVYTMYCVLRLNYLL